MEEHSEQNHKVQDPFEAFKAEPICSCDAAEKLAKARTTAVREASKARRLQVEIERLRSELNRSQERYYDLKRNGPQPPSPEPGPPPPPQIIRVWHSASALQLAKNLTDMNVLSRTTCKDCEKPTPTYWGRRVLDSKFRMLNADGTWHKPHGQHQTPNRYQIPSATAEMAHPSKKGLLRGTSSRWIEYEDFRTPER